MGRNRRQDRLRNRRERTSEAPAAPPPARGRSGGALSSGGKPPWRETIDSWGGFTVIGAIVAAVVVAGLLVFINRPGSSAGDAEFVAEERPAPVAGNVIGNPDAPVRIIEYGDFQCPHCKNFFDTIEPTLVEEFVATGIATFEYRNFAFIGPESFAAGEAAMCAADQNRFWDFHDILFLRQGRENSGVFSDSKLKGYAEEIGDAYDDFDVAAWQECFDSGVHEQTVEEHNQSAASSGVASTPTLFINGRELRGVQDLATYRSAIEAAAEGSN